jgi:mannose-binding lectin 1
LTSLKIVQGPKTFKVEVDGNFCFETEKVHKQGFPLLWHIILLTVFVIQVKLPSSYHFGVSALTSDTPDSFELFSILVASPEQRGDASGTQQQGIGNNEQINRESSQQNAQNEAPRAHGRTPHEQDFEEYIPEFQDTTAEMYKTPEQQFQDLHDRLQGMVGGLCDCLLLSTVMSDISCLPKNRHITWLRSNLKLECSMTDSMR